jgi:hypothetical protein
MSNTDSDERHPRDASYLPDLLETKRAICAYGCGHFGADVRRLVEVPDETADEASSRQS